MLKISLVSDTHNEFQKREKYSPKFNGENAIILAGDIQVGLNEEEWFLSLLETRDVFYVIGNHECYSNDFTKILNDLPLFENRVNELAKSKGFNYKLYCGQNRAIYYNGVKILMCTLWTDFKNDNPLIKLVAQRGMSDYRVIMDNNQKLTTDKILEEHKKSVEFLNIELAEEHIKKIVVTHHLPSYESVDGMFRNPRDEDFNWLFCSNLDTLAAKADYWFHGHTHCSCDYSIDNCRILANPRGYHPNQLNPKFIDGLIVDIK